MIRYDQWAVLIASCVTTVLATWVVLAHRLWERRPASGHYWELCCAAMIGASLMYLWEQNEPTLWCPTVIANSATALSMSMLWLGCRRINRKRTRAGLLLSGVAVAVVAAASFIPPLGYANVSGTAAKTAAILIFVLLGGIECLRGDLKNLRAARILAVAQLVQFAYAATRLTVLVVYHADSEQYGVQVGTGVTTIVNLVLIPVAAIAMLSLLGEIGRTNRGREEAEARALYLDREAFMLAIERRVSDGHPPTSMTTMKLPPVEGDDLLAVVDRLRNQLGPSCLVLAVANDTVIVASEHDVPAATWLGREAARTSRLTASVASVPFDITARETITVEDSSSNTRHDDA